MVKYGILVISHGSRSADWVRLVDEAVAAVTVPEGVPVYCSFLELVEGRLIQDGITSLEAEGVTDLIVVPLFVSSGSTHLDEISYALGVIQQPKLPTDLEPFSVRARVHLTSPIDDDPDIAAIIYEKIKRLSQDPLRELVLVIGHGSAEAEFHSLWQRGLDSLAARVRELGGFAEADTAMLLPDQAAQRVASWAEHRPELAVLVAPLFLSEGYFTRQVIPSRLQGCDYRYTGEALLPHPGIARWMERQVRPFLLHI
ncbi:sirohydrochlorin chelatase [Paenibacillus cremeus]|uniref:Cobalamin biosynthesis protein CbiX n=1 Tax=Paenibacillus cremeus TaxID=2163881 RepID=A0A559K964_9BACL|nr:CbiX/SirB N-terminal domain-containing protein [Paenibacillus cremeus]TVY08664.1 cobalamin biosynthesis protein CbiX [Paenibacillus cremeus]